MQADEASSLGSMVGEHWLVATLLAIDLAVRLAIGVRVILRRMHVPAALAWLVVLVFLPVASPFLYLLIGENRLSARRARTLDALGRDRFRSTVDLWQSAAVSPDEQEAWAGPIARLCTSSSGFPAMPSNALELMDDASAVLARLVQDIDGAVDHCHLLYYIWQPGGGGAMVGEALMRAAARGVACRVLVDAVGSKAFLRSELRGRMAAAGVRIVAALPVNPLRMLFARIDLRNHRKIAVIDGVAAYCGSQNLTDESFCATRNRRVGLWLDTTIRVTGHAVHPLQAIFLQDWVADSEEALPDLGRFFPPPKPGEGTSIAHVVPSGPGPQPGTIHQALLAMLHGAREEILMTTPYFVPDEPMKAALVNAALRGVSVTLVLPDLLDARIVAAASRAHYEDLLEVGVVIMHHDAGLLHAKTATVDRRLALVTSANLDMRSFWLNFEVSVFVYDRDFAGMLRFLQTKYLGQSHRVHLDEWRRRPLWRRFSDNVAQLFGPLM